jgi:hypothetical protein
MKLLGIEILNKMQMLVSLLLTAKLLLGLASTAIHYSEPHGTHDHILLSDGFGSLQTKSPASPLQAFGNHLMWGYVQIGAGIAQSV